MKKDTIDPRLEAILNETKATALRDPQAARRGKARFLQMASQFREQKMHQQEHTPGGKYGILGGFWHGKVQLPAGKFAVALILALLILFGGASGTVLAAQNSLPGQTLYPLKTWSEDARLWMVASDPARVEQLLTFSDRRVSEIASLLADGQPLPEILLTRLRSQWDQALYLAAGMPEAQASQTLEVIRMRLQSQLERVNGMLDQRQGGPMLLLEETQARLQEQLRLTSFGETDLPGLQQHLDQEKGNLQDPTKGASGTETFQAPTPAGISTGTQGPMGPGPNSEATPGPNAEATPGSGDGTGQNGPGGQNPDITPQPGAGAGQKP